MSVRSCSCPASAQCRRCGANILEGRLTLYVDAHDATPGQRVDLCGDCSGLFSAWFLRRANSTTPLQDPVNPAASATGVVPYDTE
jgi:hypothetical protein